MFCIHYEQEPSQPDTRAPIPTICVYTNLEDPIMTMPHAVRYGAAEIAEGYNRNLGLALGLSVGVHLALIGLYLFCFDSARAGEEIYPGPRHTIALIDTRRQEITPPAGHAGDAAPASAAQPSGASELPRASAASIASAMLPVPDTLVAEGNLVPAGTIGSSMPQEGGGRGGDSGSVLPRTPATEHTAPARAAEIRPMTEFIAYEKEPVWDQHDLQSRVRYPEIARRNDIQGDVVLRAYIDIHGRVGAIDVDRSDNQILTGAAIEAVRATVFAPALQNGEPVGVWIQVPVSFRLD